MNNMQQGRQAFEAIGNTIKQLQKLTQDPTLENFGEVNLDEIEEHLKPFMKNLITLAQLNPEILKRIAVMRHKLNNDIKLTRAETEEFQTLSCNVGNGHEDISETAELHVINLKLNVSRIKKIQKETHEKIEDWTPPPVPSATETLLLSKLYDIGPAAVTILVENNNYRGENVLVMEESKDQIRSVTLEGIELEKKEEGLFSGLLPPSASKQVELKIIAIDGTKQIFMLQRQDN